MLHVFFPGKIVYCDFIASPKMDSTASNSSPSALPLTPQSFTQQGTINWDSLAHRSVTFSVDVLNRCANAGVDPYSVVVGQAIARSFPLSRRGRENIAGSVETLGCQNGLQNVLWFGFGVRAFARTMALTSEGTNLLALCSTLAECFHDGLASEVMYSIVKAYGAPGKLTPSTTQWSAIVRACSGVLASSKFPVLAEGFMRLDPGSARVSQHALSWRDSPTFGAVRSPKIWRQQ